MLSSFLSESGVTADLGTVAMHRAVEDIGAIPKCTLIRRTANRQLDCRIKLKAIMVYFFKIDL